jgi:spore germination cell wall hydrolase CwlJ-like protein
LLNSFGLRICLILGILTAFAAIGKAAQMVEPGCDPYFPDDPADVTFTLPKYAPNQLEVETVAACLVLEAACQGMHGMRGVMAVIRNRSRGLPELFVHTVLRPKQFSSLNRVTTGQESLYRALRRAKKDQMWSDAVALVKEASGDEWSDPTYGATHFTRSGERNRWTKNLKRTVTIASHSFYKQ